MTRTGRPAAVDTAVVVVLAAVAAFGLDDLFGRRWLLAAAVGALLGVALAWWGARSRVPGLVLVLAGAVGYLLVASAVALPEQAAAGVLPTGTTARAVVEGAVYGWKQALTLEPPLDGAGALLVLPLLLLLVTTALAVSFALRASRPWTALLPIAALLAAVGVLGSGRDVLPLPQGVALLALALSWTAWRRRSALAVGSSSPLGRRRAITGTAVLLAAGSLAGAAGAATTGDEERYALRDKVQPPLDPREYASPLVGFRRYVKDLPDTELLSVSGLPEGSRLRIATLDGYDGVVWSATGGGGDGSGEFRRVGSRTGAPVGPTTPVEVEVRGYTGVWVPTVGDSAGIVFEGERADGLAPTLHYNAATGTGLATAGLRSGDRYVLQASVPPVPGDSVLAGVQPASLVLPELRNVPDVVTSTAGDLAGDQTTPLERVRALEGALAAGFFSHGLAGDPPSRAGHGADRMALLLESPQLLGDEEQYASAMVLMARQLGFPARVVMGFAPKGAGDVVVTGDDVSAWAEVAFEGVGWVVVDPSPPKDRALLEQPPKAQSKPRPQVPQPPPTEELLDPPPPAVAEEGEAEPPTEDDRDGASGAGRVLRLVGLAGGSVLALLSPLLLLTGLRLRRRRRRLRRGTASDRIAGGWAELLDTAVDLGTRPPARATRRETAAVVEQEHGQVGALVLAERADAGVFAPGEPTEQDVERFWAEVDGARRGLAGSVGLRRRWRGRLLPASVLRRR